MQKPPILFTLGAYVQTVKCRSDFGVQSLSFLTLATPWTVALLALLSMGLPRQESLSSLPFPPPENLLDPRTEPMSPALASGFFTIEPLGKPTELTTL